VLFGLTLGHEKKHIARAIMESIGYVLRYILELLEDYGVSVREIRSTGGAARSSSWLQIKSDICRFPFVKMIEEDAASLGAAVISSVKMGEYSSIEEAVHNIVKIDSVFHPQEANRSVYDEAYHLYRRVYDQLKPLFAHDTSYGST
jgi:sugar (pentulose or hexulose) kinase